MKPYELSCCCATSVQVSNLDPFRNIFLPLLWYHGYEPNRYSQRNRFDHFRSTIRLYKRFHIAIVSVFYGWWPYIPTGLFLDSETSTTRECNFFFPGFDIPKWYAAEEAIFRRGDVRFDEATGIHVAMWWTRPVFVWCRKNPSRSPVSPKRTPFVSISAIFLALAVCSIFNAFDDHV